MPTSPLDGLVEGLLRGKAVKQQKEQEAYQREREHATDIFNQHVQTWRETQSAQDRTDQLAQQTIQNKQAQDRIDTQKAEEDRKVASDKARQDFAKDAAAAKTEAQKAALYFKAIGPGLGYSPEQATMLTGYTPPAQSAPLTLGGGAEGALSLLGTAGQGQAPPGAGLGGVHLPGAQQAPMIPGQMAPPFSTGPRPTFPGVAPMVKAKIDQTNQQTALAAAKIPKLTTENVNLISQIAHRKAMDENMKEMQKLTKEKVALTHAQTERTKALAELDPSLKMAQTNLANARAGAEIARAEYIGVQEQHTKTLDALKIAGKDLSDYKKRGDILKQAKDAESKFTKDRYVQEKAREKTSATLQAYQHTSEIDATKLERTADQVAVKIAKDMIPKLQQDLKDADARIANLTAQEKEAHKYTVDTTTFLNKDGTTKVYATDKERQEAEKQAKEAQAAADAAYKAAHKSGTRLPHVPDMDSRSALPKITPKGPIPQTPPKGSKIIKFDANGNMIQ